MYATRFDLKLGHPQECKHSPTHSLTLCSRALVEKLIGSQLVKKFPAFYGTQRFINVFTNVRNRSLSWARSIQSILPHPTSWRSILILSSNLRLGIPSGLFPSDFPTKTLHKLIVHTCCMQHPPPSRLDHPNNIWWALQIIKLFIT